MKTLLAYILPALIAFALVSYCLVGVADGISLAMTEVGRVLAGGH